MAADPLTQAVVDDLFNFDSTDDEDPFNDNKKPSRAGRDDKPTLSPRHKRKAGDDEEPGADLGLDEEVKIAKKRKPIAKLDEASPEHKLTPVRLLSAPGIPKLRVLARSGKFNKKLRLKGKGHEFSDVARLLNYYQLWLDNLYPRARFADGLQLVEKVGHSKRMQIMRKEWIDEGKPGYIRDKSRNRNDDYEQEKETDDLYGGDKPVEDKNTSRAAAPQAEEEEGDSLFIPDSRDSGKDLSNENDLPEDDELDALLAEQDAFISTSDVQPRLSNNTKTGMDVDVDIDSEGEDDLDALLAEQETRRRPAPSASVSASVPRSNAKPKSSPFNEDDGDDDDLDALLAEQEARSKPKTPQATTTQREPTDLSPDDNEDEHLMDNDDLDALLAEQEARHQATSHSRPSGEDTSATPPPDAAALFIAAAEGEAAGDEMFSSSPVRTTQHSGVVAPEAEAEPEVDVNEGKQQDEEDEARDGAEGVLEAGDMFSSSPVQNE
ncbi:chromosome segregation in meiosis-related protein [Exophiala xenobiotica]|nr:chromosome segregation in meiosis-related protein [Exophiala xenobiotica]